MTNISLLFTTIIISSEWFLFSPLVWFLFSSLILIPLVSIHSATATTITCFSLSLSLSCITHSLFFCIFYEILLFPSVASSKISSRHAPSVALWW
mmetsp:Transcript_29193/g.41318  ORF Transcript_29193/g.41318 Transcript_29193/m.41318 type:complete len:95 (-) Transcript_29193:464-748(-)